MSAPDLPMYPVIYIHTPHYTHKRYYNARHVFGYKSEVKHSV